MFRNLIPKTNYYVDGSVNSGYNTSGLKKTIMNKSNMTAEQIELLNVIGFKIFHEKEGKMPKRNYHRL